MGENVLSVTCAEVQSSEGTDTVLTHIVDSQIEKYLFAFFVNLLLNLTCDLLNDFLDAGRMDSTVRNKAFKRLFCNFLANRIKTADNNCFWSVIDNDVNACECFKRTDITAFTTDDPAFHFIAWQ